MPKKKNDEVVSVPAKKVVNGMMTAIRAGELTAKEAVRKLKRLQADGEYIHPDTLKYYESRAARETARSQPKESTES